MFYLIQVNDYFVSPNVICILSYYTQHAFIFVHLCLLSRSVIVMNLSYSMSAILFYLSISVIHVYIS